MDIWTFDKQIIRLLAQREFDRAEAQLLAQYSAAKEEGQRELVDHVLLRLAHLFVAKRDYKTAEKYYLERERLSPWPNSGKICTAMFYLWGAQDHRKALKKLNEIRLDETSEADLRQRYSVLHLKGRALLALGRTKAAGRVLGKIMKLTEDYPAKTSSEMEFIEEMVEKKVELQLCKKYVLLVRNRIRDEEYKKRATTLLRQLRDIPVS